MITGRPARQALALGDLDEVGNALGDSGKELYLFGQYGNERWSSTSRRIVSPRPPRGLASYLGALPSLLRRLDAADAFVEEKGLAVAVHTRRLPDPAGAFARLLPELEKLATDAGLVVEPGRQVIEARAPGMDKGQVVRKLAEDLSASGFLFAGDDLGDLEAFEAVAASARRACRPSWSARAPRSSTPWPPTPTWSSTDPTASSPSSASSPPTPSPDSPSRDARSAWAAELRDGLSVRPPCGPGVRMARHAA